MPRTVDLTQALRRCKRLTARDGRLRFVYPRADGYHVSTKRPAQDCHVWNGEAVYRWATGAKAGTVDEPLTRELEQ